MKWQFYRLAGSFFFACVLLFWSFGELVDAYEASQDSYTLSATQLFSDKTPTRQTIPRDQLQLPAALNDELRAGRVVALQSANADWFYYRQTSQPDQLYRVGPFPAPADDNRDSMLILLMFYACLMLASAAMLYPLFRDLHRLQQQAGVFMAAPAQMQQQISKHSSIYPLARDFVAAGNQLVRWFELHQFLSRAISHDVRTPLSRMRFALELCEDDMPAQYWQRLQTDVHQIEQLVTNYLNFARLEQQRQPANLQYIELSAFAAHVQQQFNWQASDISLQFAVGDGFAWLDPFSVEIAWQNLVVNAVRFAKKQVHCRLSTHDGRLEFSVEDDGPGFAEDFDITEFSAPHEPSTSGYGLGLYIVKHVVSWHHGHIHIDRSPTLGGARVLIALPMTHTATSP